MEHSTVRASSVVIGLDVGDEYSYLLSLDQDGTVLEEDRVKTTPEAIRDRFSRVAPSRVALEVGTHSAWVSEEIKSCGHEVIVANSRRLRFIYENPCKSDRIDAEYLARVARLDPKLLHPVKHRGPEIRKCLAAIRARDALVKVRTLLVNHVRGAVKTAGGRIKGCSTASFHKQAPEQVPEAIRGIVRPLLEMVGEVTAQIQRYDSAVETVCEKKFPETERLRQVPGVGFLTALAFVLILADPRRFKKSRDVGPYVGLVPRKHDSGLCTPQLRITKAGDALLRRLLVSSAHYLLGPFAPDTDLRTFGQKIAQRGGKNAKKRAVVAVARKLAVLLHRLWVTGETYEPLRNTQRRLKRQASRSQQHPTPLSTDEERRA